MSNKILLRKLMLVTLTALITGASMAQLPKHYVTTNITTSTTWTNDSIHVLSGYIYVTKNSTLTIEEGTVIYGNDPSLFSKGALIVTRGSRIRAIGTACAPIVFTSGAAINKRVRGDWGGLILLGRAPINAPGGVANIEGIPPSNLTQYGGGTNPKPTDNSGTLSYVRIEYAGVALSPNNEINGLTMGGVGSNTVLNHIQVSFSNDDSYEWFGGTVNAKYLIAFRGIDDDFDTDLGYSGYVQFGIGLRDPAVADVSKSHGFESDNDANGSANTPQTSAIFSNITSVAGGDTVKNSLYESGALLRRNTAFHITNSIVMGFPVGVIFQNSPNAIVDYSILGVRSAKYVDPVGTGASQYVNNRQRTGNGSIQLVRPYTLGNPDFKPKSTSIANTGSSFTGLPAFFTPTTYVGAVSQNANEDWTDESWVNWNPGSTDYSNGSIGIGCKSAAKESATAAVTADAQISPNPNKGLFNVELKGFATSTVNVKIAALNSGKVYYAGKATNNSITKISINVPAGNYAVELSDGKNVISKKVSILY